MTIDVLKTLHNNSKCPTNSSSIPARRVSSVRRSLFGEVNHEESMSFLKRELDAIAESQKKKWNFDFTNEKPLESCEIEWTPVQPDEIVPKPYALSRLPYLYENTETEPCSQPSIPSQSSRLQQVTISKTILKQTLLDGYIKSRKRSERTVISKSESCSSCNAKNPDTQCTCYHPSSKKLCLTPSKNSQN